MTKCKQGAKEKWYKAPLALGAPSAQAHRGEQTAPWEPEMAAHSGSLIRGHCWREKPGTCSRGSSEGNWQSQQLISFPHCGGQERSLGCSWHDCWHSLHAASHLLHGEQLALGLKIFFFLDDLDGGENNTASPEMSTKSIFNKPKFASPEIVEPTQ